MPTWIVLIEGHAPATVRSAGDVLAPQLSALHATAMDIAVYRHEFTRLKTPWSAG